ncbi:MAG: right-handed parallel beta-helix repeat-containing protein [Methanobrevibacter sp.]
MNKKRFIIILLVLAIFTLNFSMAQDVDSANGVVLSNLGNSADSNSTDLIKTDIDVVSYTNFNAVGGNFKIKLVDENKTGLASQNVTFDINGVTYDRITDDEGIASLKLRLDDGLYNITTEFFGNSVYGASSKTTLININNTRIVDAGMPNSQIQEIIDNAKVNNVILFNGGSYDDINLIINKSLTLISNSNTVLKSGSSAPVITIQGKNASLTKIKGFVIKGEGDGILVNGSDYVILSNNEITSNGNGITAKDTSYLNITDNSIVKNAKNGIVVLNDSYTYITGNDISGNGDTGILISKSNSTYIYSNSITSNKYYGISTTDTVDGVNYGEGPENLQIVTNTISKNGETGIDIDHAKDNLQITGNTIISNKRVAISMNDVGSNLVQSNIITDHKLAIQFTDDYIRPDNQEISYNAFILNTKDLEARDTGYDEEVNQLKLEDNWHTDYGFVCPKIQAGKIKFSVTHLGGDYFQATFLDSNGKVASLLPDRTLTYQTDDGSIVSLSVSGGTAVFRVNGVSADIFKATIDRSPRTADYDKNSGEFSEYTGKSPQYSYPSISGYGLYEDIGGNGDGDYIGEGYAGDANNGKGDSSRQSGEFTGNSTSSQKADPSSRANGQVNDVSQSSGSEVAAAVASASQSRGDSSSAATSGEKQSVIKQVIIDDEDIFRVTGMSFIVLLILLTIAYYYKDDIKEMKSKM